MPAGTSNLMPVVADPLLVQRTDPDDLDTRTRLPRGLVGTSVPEAGLARIIELHPLEPVDST